MLFIFLNLLRIINYKIGNLLIKAFLAKKQRMLLIYYVKLKKKSSKKTIPITFKRNNLKNQLLLLYS